MKLTVLALSLLIGSMANAATKESCNKVIEASRCNTSILETDVAYFASECKIIQLSGKESHVVYISEAGARLMSINTGDCSASLYAFKSGLIISGDNSNKVLDGRLFSVLSSARVVMVDTDNAIYELNNSSNKPYSDVVGLSVKDGVLTLLRERNQKTELTMKQIDDRIRSNKIELLDKSVRF